MKLCDYIEQNNILLSDLDARNKAVSEFFVQHGDLLDDEVYARYWKLHDEASCALGKLWEFQAKNRHKVVR